MIVALDLETTWIDKENDKIIELALVKFDENTFEIIETFSTLINPLIPIPEVISNITNIFDDDVKNSPILDKELKEKILFFIWENPILGHNTIFDRDFFIKAWIDISKNILLDTFVLSNIMFFEEKSLNLWALCESKNLSLLASHRAMDDTMATIKLFEVLIKNAKKFPKQKKEILNFIFSKSQDNQFEFYANLFDFWNEIISEEKFTKNILKIIWKYRDVGATLCDYSDEEEKKSYDFPSVQEIFENIPNFEFRQNQLTMSKKADELLKNNNKIVIEAPTWVWKTFAYLIPSIIYSLKNEEQIFVSTNTKTLQDQIFYKDLYFLKKNLNIDFSYTKLKWKKNYFSISEYLNYFFWFNKFDWNETTFFSKISLWLFETEFWELDELNYYWKEWSFLKNINADNFLILKDNNKYKYYEYIFKARSLAIKSNIVIINHSLLVQDINSISPIFWQIQNLIIDEAHNLEDTTTSALKKSFWLNNLKENIDKILSILNKNNYFIDNLDNKFWNLSSLVNLVFDLFIDYINKSNNYSNEIFEVLIKKDFFIQNKDIINVLNNIEILYIEILNLLSTTPDNVFNKLKSEISFFEEIIQIIKISLDEKSSINYIPTFSYNSKWNHNICYTVLNVWEFLKNNLWDKIDSCLITSATLKVWENFDYISNTLNLKSDFDFLALESDFDYSHQVLLFIPNDLWTSKFNNPKISDFLLKFLTIVKWKTIILLTSFNSIKELYLSLNIPLKKLKINLLPQSIWWSKFKISNHFKKYSQNSVILWADSFWEWVDIPWDDLKYLVIHKFPFMVPTDPIFKARSKLYKNSFTDYSIPKAILKTKQWFWRLIRTKNDTWIVVLLDDRIINTSWWWVLKDSFPSNINLKIWNSMDFLKLLWDKSKLIINN